MGDGDDDDDQVLESLPLYLNTTLTPYLHTIHNAPADEQLKCKMKLRHGWLWVEQPASPHHPTFDTDRAKELSSQAAKSAALPHPQLAFDFAQSRAAVGEICSPPNDHFVMVKRHDAVLLLPVAGACKLRPSLLPLDMASSGGADSNKQPRPQFPAAAVAEEQRILPHFQKRETEEQQAARLSSYEHLHKVWEEEAWTVMSHYPEGCRESSALSATLANPVACTAGADLAVHPPEQFLLNLGLAVDE